jgi:hypothetical protein
MQEYMRSYMQRLPQAQIHKAYILVVIQASKGDDADDANDYGCPNFNKWYWNGQHLRATYWQFTLP